MMNNLKSIALSEVYDILKYMNKMSVMKIPTEILEYIRNNKNIEFISNVDKNDIFNKKRSYLFFIFSIAFSLFKNLLSI